MRSTETSPPDTAQESVSASETAQESSEAPQARFGSLTPQEAAQRASLARQQKAAARQASAEESALTVRQRVGVALSKLSQRDWDETVKHASVPQRVALMNQAFGQPQPAEPEPASEGAFSALSREERAELLRQLESVQALPEAPREAPREAAREPGSQGASEAQPGS